MAQGKTAALKQLPGMNLATWRDIGVPLAVLGIVIALITPLPPFAMDILIVTDIMMLSLIHISEPTRPY